MTKEIKHQICGDGFIQCHPKKEALAQPEQCTYPDCNYPCMSLPDCKQPEQEPMHPQLKAMLEEYFDKCFAESSPQRKPLTDEEIEKCYETTGHYQTLRPQDRFAVFALARAIEAAHGIKEKT